MPDPEFERLALEYVERKQQEMTRPEFNTWANEQLAYYAHNDHPYRIHEYTNNVIYFLKVFKD